MEDSLNRQSQTRIVTVLSHTPVPFRCIRPSLPATSHPAGSPESHSDFHNLPFLPFEYMYSSGPGLGRVDPYRLVVASLRFDDFFAPTTRLSDGVVLVINIHEPMADSELESAISHIVREMLLPILVVSGLDLFMQEPETTYEQCDQVIRKVNRMVSAYSAAISDPHKRLSSSSLELSPQKGSVVFASGDLSWAFTLERFAEVLAKNRGKCFSTPSIVENLWGDHYFDYQTKKWLASPGEGGKRGFVEFVLAPLASPEFSSGSETSLSRIFYTPQTMCDAIVRHLPSPRMAQLYRCAVLYSGWQDDVYANAIKTCNPKGPLMVYLAESFVTTKRGEKMVNFSVARVFSGSLACGKQVRILGPDFVPGAGKCGLLEGKVRDLCGIVWTGKENAARIEPAGLVTCGNACLLPEFDYSPFVTVTDCQSTDVLPNPFIKLPSPLVIVKLTVEPAESHDLHRMMEGLQRLVAVHQNLVLYYDNNSRCIIGAETLAEIRSGLNDYDQVCHGPPLLYNFADAVLSYRETVTAGSSQICLAKSPNNHNLFYLQAAPLSDSEYDSLTAKQDPTDKWTPWISTPEHSVLVDSTTQPIGCLSDARKSIIAGFQFATREGVLAGEPVCGTKYSLVDAIVCTNRMTRGSGGQMIPPAKRACLAAELTAEPRLQEPIYSVELIFPKATYKSVMAILGRRTGTAVVDERWENRYGRIRATIPAAEALELETDMSAILGGEKDGVVVRFEANGWKTIREDPLDPGSRTATLLDSIRKVKDMKVGVQSLWDYIDKR